ncbi:MAG: NAD(P)-dependent oxidoreductase [Bacillota bacterium]|nr:NAD(P)-dependent oxidoreductase [Bacillota bacterium]
MPSVLITGASGCVGHYVVDEFAAAGYEAYLLVRNPAKLRFDPATRPNVTVVRGDLTELSAHAALLSQMDYCVHTAAAWGGPAAWEVNVRRTHELFTLLNPERVRRIVYFSTASILGRGNRLLHEVDRYGTDYIRSKYRAYVELPQSPNYERIVTVFPTLVFGGDRGHPTSHLSSGLPLLKRWAWLLGRLDTDAWFHFIHARDIARLVRHLVEAEQVEKDNVLGNEPLSFGEFTRRVAAYFGHRIGWQLHLSPQAMYRFARLMGARMSPWDRFCIEYGDFRYRTVNCPAVGLPGDLSTLEGILADWERAQREAVVEP